MKSVLINTNQLQLQLSSTQKKLQNNDFCVGIKPAVLDLAKQSTFA